jgi:exopolysaccharide biosynthesis polyprenyl glycosylphosphotransferase
MSIALGRQGSRSRSGVESFTQRIAITDTLVIIWSVIGAHVVRFGTDGVSDGTDGPQASNVGVSYAVVSVILIVLWLVALKVHNAYDPRLFGHGPEEYRAVAGATLRLFAAVAILSYLFKLELARGFLLIALPFGLAGLFLSRWIWRRWLGAQRADGRLCDAMLIVGDRDHLNSLVAALREVPEAGYRIVGACCSDGNEPIRGVPIVGLERDAAVMAERLDVSVVACSGSWRLGSEGLRRLGWNLESTGIGLVLAPGMTQVAGPRILTRPVAGLPLLHVEAPTFTGPKRAVKTAFDVFGALALGIVLSPLLLVVAVLVARDGGPPFYSQTRVGQGGAPFLMWKFRSMVPNADTIVPAIAHDGAGPLYKLKSDPRITPLGRVLRRTSIDELPQLWNVLRGEMSLVGPRPPLASEVERYEEDVYRRLLVKPGMTGLWQVSGRSDLPWEDSVRLDLYYVENWNLVEDLKILWRTVSTVVHHQGAY